MKLCKSYRSTFEITCFAQKILLNEELEPIVRHGKQPVDSFNTEIQKKRYPVLIDLIFTFKKSNYKSLGLYVKQKFSNLCRKTVYIENVYFLSNQSSAFGKRYPHHFVAHGERTGV